MLRNYLITAFRNLWRKRGSTFINISGLSIGIAGSIILFLIVSFHLSFDGFHSKKDRIFRVANQSKGNNGNEYTAGIPNVLPDAFRNDFPEAEEVIFTSYRSGGLITIPGKNGEEPKKYSAEKGIVYTVPGYFNLFDRTSVSGDPIKALDEPNEAVISDELAKQYFGRVDVIGELVRFEDRDYRISAVIEESPANTDFPFDLLLSYITIKKESEERGGWNSIWSDEQCYFLLKEGEQLSTIENRMKDFTIKYRGKEEAETSLFIIQPFNTIHSDDRFGNYNYSTISPNLLLSLSAIALLLVLTASINFINLTTAEAIKRSKEVGIRKSLGSTRGQLVSQFLGETTLVTIFSLVIAIIIVQGSLPFLSSFIQQKLAMNLASNVNLWIFLISITIIVSLLSGLYPSFVVSAFKPTQALKNMISAKNSSGYNLRRGLVVAQFFISQVFIIGTIVLINQTQFLNNKPLGFSRDAIINIPIPVREQPGKSEGRMRTLREQISALSGVEKASLNASAPSSGNVSGTNFHVEGAEKDFGTQVKQVDGNYVDLFKLELIAGKNIADADTAAGYIVNEKLAETAGFVPATDIVGKEINMWGKKLPVVGVVKDFNTVSLSNPIDPVIILNRLRGFGNLSVKLNPVNMQSTIDQIKEKWEAAYPESIFSFQFMDDQIKEFYDEQRRMSVLLAVFSSMAIFIGCLGLFGLATFMANQKTKEIGIRKVMGASIGNILWIFTREFGMLILIGFVLAVPISFVVINKFLEQFEYKVDVGPSVFLAGVVITTVIAAVTVGYRSLRAATVNPVDSLKCE